MNSVRASGFLLWILLAAIAVAQGALVELRTGYYRTSATPLDILGPGGSAGIGNILSVDTNIEWEILVPKNYSAAAPPGLVVYVSPTDSGGPPRDWTDMLAAHNLVWIGARNSGNDWPVPERMLKAMIAPTFVRQSYVIDPERVYVAGLSGGGKTATRVATAKPELFKGGVYMAGTVFWENNTPPKIEMIKQNYHVFMIGSNDPGLRTTQRTYKNYKEAGVAHSKLITIRNYKHRMPPGEYFEKAITYLDTRLAQ